MSAEMQSELDAIDAMLRGEAVTGAQPPLEELVRALRSGRPRPSGQFARALDARAARGFTRERRAGAGSAARREPSTGHRGRAGRRTLLALPALGLVVAVVLVVISMSGSGAGPRAQAGATSAPSPAGPSRVLMQSQLGNATARPASPAGGASASAAPGSAARQVERTSTLDVGVAPGAVQATAQRVFTLVSAFNGYVRQSSVSSGGVGQSGASFDVRLPSASLAAAIAALSHLGHVRSESDTTNDVTEQVGALQRSLGEEQAQRASLLKQLGQATEAEKAAALKAQLHEVDSRIAQLQGEQHALAARVDYTRVALSLSSEVTAGTSTGDLTPGGAAHDAAQILSAALAVLVIAAAAVLPLGALIIAAWLAVQATRRRLREQGLDAS
jgi:hypothetical protein